MGCEGGLSWIYLKDASKKDTFRKLVTPVGFKEFWSNEDYHDEDHKKFLEKNSEYKGIVEDPSVYVCVWSNSLGRTPSFEDLWEVISEVKYYKEGGKQNYYQYKPHLLTFEEFLLHLETRPDHMGMCSYLETLCKNAKWHLKKNETFLKKNIFDWTQEVLECLDPGLSNNSRPKTKDKRPHPLIGDVETWT